MPFAVYFLEIIVLCLVFGPSASVPYYKKWIGAKYLISSNIIAKGCEGRIEFPTPALLGRLKQEKHRLMMLSAIVGFPLGPEFHGRQAVIYLNFQFLLVCLLALGPLEFPCLFIFRLRCGLTHRYKDMRIFVRWQVTLPHSALTSKETNKRMSTEHFSGAKILLVGPSQSISPTF